MRFFAVAAAAALALAACGTAPEQAPAPPDDAANGAAEAESEAKAQPERPGCPFRETGDWAGSVQSGRVLVTGEVDLMMAGMRPTLTPRSGGGGTLALDLTLEPDPQAAVENRVRYEAGGAPNYRRGEIWCGGERIAAIGMTVVD